MFFFMFSKKFSAFKITKQKFSTSYEVNNANYTMFIFDLFEVANNIVTKSCIAVDTG